MKKTLLTLALFLFTFYLSAQNNQVIIEKGKELVKTNACTACHKEYGPNLAPGFSGIGIIYKKANEKEAVINISATIAKGSIGQYTCFKDAVMPPYAHLSETNRTAIAVYILSLTKDYKVK